MILISIPLSSVLTRTFLDFKSADDYYPLWSYDLFAFQNPYSGQRHYLRIHKLNDIEFPQGKDFFSLFPTTGYFDINPSIVFGQLASATQQKRRLDEQIARGVIERSFFSRYNRVFYSVHVCTFQSVKMWKTGL